MMCVVNFVLPFSQLQGVEWGWPGRGNTTMNTPQLRRGGGIASSSNLVLLVLALRGVHILFVTQLPSWSDGLYLLFGVFLPQYASYFSQLVIFRNPLHVFSQVLGLSLCLFLYFSVPYFGLACDHGNSSLCLEE